MNPPILDRSRPATSISDFQPDEIKSFLRRKLSGGRVQAAYLFGSFTQGTTNAWSDLDIVIVRETDIPFPERPREFEDLFELGIPVDLLVYTPQEFEDLRKSKSGFWKEFERQEVRIV